MFKYYENHHILCTTNFYILMNAHKARRNSTKYRRVSWNPVSDCLHYSAVITINYGYIVFKIITLYNINKWSRCCCWFNFIRWQNIKLFIYSRTCLYKVVQRFLYCASPIDHIMIFALPLGLRMLLCLSATLTANLSESNRIQGDHLEGQQRLLCEEDRGVSRYLVMCRHRGWKYPINDNQCCETLHIHSSHINLMLFAIILNTKINRAYHNKLLIAIFNLIYNYVVGTWLGAYAWIRHW